MNELVKITNGLELFSIKNMTRNLQTKINLLGHTPYDILEIETTIVGGYVYSITCINQENMVEEEIKLAEPDKLFKCRSVGFCFDDYEFDMIDEKIPFQLVFTSQELDIILSRNIDDVFKYCKNERVEYYMDEEDKLLYIRIRDLTPEEYKILKENEKRKSIVEALINSEESTIKL